DLFSRLTRANELLASVRVLSGNQPFVLFASDFSFQSPLLGQSAIPLSTHFARFAVVVLLRADELLPVVILRLSSRERLTHRHHWLNLVPIKLLRRLKCDLLRRHY